MLRCRRRQSASRRTLWLIALVTVAPVVASYAAYYLFPRDRQVNSGELLVTRPAPAVCRNHRGRQAFDLASLRGKWVLAAAAPAPCDAQCERSLYATRQARTIQGREMDRVIRVWFVDRRRAAVAGDPRTASATSWSRRCRSRCPGGLARRRSDRIYLIDPLGNLVLAYARDPDIKGMAKDLTRLLKASRIG